MESKQSYDEKQAELEVQLAAIAERRNAAQAELELVQPKTAECNAAIERGQAELIDLLHNNATIKGQQQRCDAILEQIQIRKRIGEDGNSGVFFCLGDSRARHCGAKPHDRRSRIEIKRVALADQLFRRLAYHYFFITHLVKTLILILHSTINTFRRFFETSHYCLL